MKTNVHLEALTSGMKAKLVSRDGIRTAGRPSPRLAPVPVTASRPARLGDVVGKNRHTLLKISR